MQSTWYKNPMKLISSTLKVTLLSDTDSDDPKNAWRIEAKSAKLYAVLEKEDRLGNNGAAIVSRSDGRLLVIPAEVATAVSTSIFQFLTKTSISSSSIVTATASYYLYLAMRELAIKIVKDGWTFSVQDDFDEFVSPLTDRSYAMVGTHMHDRSNNRGKRLFELFVAAKDYNRCAEPSVYVKHQGKTVLVPIAELRTQVKAILGRETQGRRQPLLPKSLGTLGATENSGQDSDDDTSLGYFDEDADPRTAKIRPAVPKPGAKDSWGIQTTAGEVLTPNQLRIYLSVCKQPLAGMPLVCTFAGALITADEPLPESVKEAFLTWVNTGEGLSSAVNQRFKDYESALEEENEPLPIAWYKAMLIAAIRKAIDDAC